MFGIYIHIPFCLQRCHYCDFATYAEDQIKVNRSYVDSLLLEIDKRRHLIPEQVVHSIYFGGGTPSLLPPSEISRIVTKIRQSNFTFSSPIEITMEINPATLNEEKLQNLIQAGVNRFSVGSQTFNDDLLKACGRKHSKQDTLDTLTLIKNHCDNYSLDLLFALPHQKVEGLILDLEIIKEINPPHVSSYCLTLPDKHPMNIGREPDEEQIKMFQIIKEHLSKINLHRYEISNFSRPGFESVHNMIYWRDKNYWGLGLSAHSYIKAGDWGYRFWNASDYKQYLKQIDELDSKVKTLPESFPAKQLEQLQVHQSLTDYCHTALRTTQGLSEDGAHQKYGPDNFAVAEKRLNQLMKNNLLLKKSDHWFLSDQGLLLSNQVFSQLLFSDIDISSTHPIIRDQ